MIVSTPEGQRIPATAGQTIGPFFGFGLPYELDNEIAHPWSPGSIVLTGNVYQGDGNPIPDPARLTWVDKWEKTESAGDKTPPKESKNTAGVEADEADDALAAAIAALLEGE